MADIFERVQKIDEKGIDQNDLAPFINMRPEYKNAIDTIESMFIDVDKEVNSTFNSDLDWFYKEAYKKENNSSKKSIHSI